MKSRMRENRTSGSVRGSRQTLHSRNIAKGVSRLSTRLRAMLIDSVVQREAVRSEQMILQYESLIAELPKGSITCRKNGYYYLRYREDGKLYDRYIGKGAEKVDAIREKLALRKHYTEMLSALKREQKTVHRLLEELA